MPLDQAKKMMTARLIDSLYTEAMLLADEARSYFDEIGRAERNALTPLQRVGFSCESLKVTTRLMHVIAWLLTRKAIAVGEISEDDGRSAPRRLGHAIDTEQEALDGLPTEARDLILATMDLYQRVARIDQDMIEPEADSPALGLLRRLERTL